MSCLIRSSLMASISNAGLRLRLALHGCSFTKVSGELVLLIKKYGYFNFLCRFKLRFTFPLEASDALSVEPFKQQEL